MSEYSIEIIITLAVVAMAVSFWAIYSLVKEWIETDIDPHARTKPFKLKV